jgi:hypothetical protein
MSTKTKTTTRRKLSNSEGAKETIGEAMASVANAVRSISHGIVRPEGLEMLSMAVAGEGPWGKHNSLAASIESGLDAIASAIRETNDDTYSSGSASDDVLMNQATSTACHYMNHGVRYIDEKFGEGYAAKHPELLGQFMRTAAQDFDTAMRIKY